MTVKGMCKQGLPKLAKSVVAGLLGGVLWLNAQAVYSVQGEGVAQTITVWAYSLYTPAVTNNIIKPFFDELASRSDYKYHLSGDRRVAELMRSCQQQQPDIIIASQSLGDKIQASCDYRVIVSSLQNIQLFRKKTTEEGVQPPIKRVGLLNHIKATEIAYQEFPDKYGEATYFVYDDIFQLIKHYRSDRLDAIALPELFLKVAPSFAANWTPLFSFKQKGVAVVLVSASLEQSLVDSLQATFLNDSALTRRVWQQKIGLGQFLHPASFQMADEKNH